LGAPDHFARFFKSTYQKISTSSYSLTYSKLQLRDISICHFQYGSICLHFTHASFYTILLVKISYIIKFDLLPHALDFTHFGSDIHRGLLELSLDVKAIFLYYILNLVIVLAIP